MVVVTEYVKQQFQLNGALSELSKQSLTNIRKNYGIKNASQYNRVQLVNVLADQLPEAMNVELNEILKLMDNERIELLELVVKQDGCMVKPHQVSDDQINYWTELALLFSANYEGQQYLYMPVEILEVVRVNLSSLDMNKMKRNSELLQLTKGMLYYYGVISHRDYFEQLKNYSAYALEEQELLYILASRANYNLEYRIDQQYIYHLQLPNPSIIYKAQSNRADIPYRYFNAIELQKAGELNFTNRNEAYQLLQKFIVSQFSLSLDQVHQVLDQAELGIRAGLSLEDVTAFISDQCQLTKLADRELLIPKIVVFMNQTPQWMLKGHSSTQLLSGVNSGPSNSTSNASSKGIGRNDACYCGSGKKFKKCCINV